MYSSHKRAFNDGLIGYLYDLSQEWPVYLLAEELDPETYSLLNNKELFPNLKEIIPVRQFSKNAKRTFFSEFRKIKGLSKIAKNAIEQYKPDIIISESDHSPAFEIYFMREAKKRNILKVVINPWLHLCSTKKLSVIVDIENVYKHLNIPLPFSWKLGIVRARKYLGHLLYYWIYPLMLLEPPFIGRSSNLLYKGESAMRDADYSIVVSDQMKRVLTDEGVVAEKLYVFPHPLERSARKVYEAAGWLSGRAQGGKKEALILWPVFEIDTKIGNVELIKKEILERRINDLKLIVDAMAGWKILVKPHPILKDMSGLKARLEGLSANVEVLQPNESILRYLDTCDVIMELSGGSAAMYLAFLIDRDKPILSLDLHNEYFGDYYKDTRGIEYVDSKVRLLEVLELIKNGSYRKDMPEKKITNDGFAGTIDLFNYFVSENKKRKAS